MLMVLGALFMVDKPEVGGNGIEGLRIEAIKQDGPELWFWQ